MRPAFVKQCAIDLKGSDVKVDSVVGFHEGTYDLAYKLQYVLPNPWPRQTLESRVVSTNPCRTTQRSTTRPQLRRRRIRPRHQLPPSTCRELLDNLHRTSHPTLPSRIPNNSKTNPRDLATRPEPDHRGMRASSGSEFRLCEDVHWL